MEITGKLIVKNDTKEFGSNGFKKREFVIETDSQYPQKIQIELIQDKCNLINNYNVGENITVSYNLNGRDWVNPQGETRYFNSIQGWKIDAAQDTDHDTAHDAPFKTVANKDLNSDKDDLPF